VETSYINIQIYNKVYNINRYTNDDIKYWWGSRGSFLVLILIEQVKQVIKIANVSFEYQIDCQTRQRIVDNLDNQLFVNIYHAA